MLDTINLLELQEKQYMHDLMYHQDIINLRTQDRIKHIVLHFIKNIAKLNSPKINDKIICDMFICCLSRDVLEEQLRQLSNNLILISYNKNINLVSIVELRWNEIESKKYLHESRKLLHIRKMK